MSPLTIIASTEGWICTDLVTQTNRRGKKKGSGMLNGMREKQENSTGSQFGSIVYN